jgi:hypothetical protein
MNRANCSRCIIDLVCIPQKTAFIFGISLGLVSRVGIILKSPTNGNGNVGTKKVTCNSASQNGTPETTKTSRLQ